MDDSHNSATNLCDLCLGLSLHLLKQGYQHTGSLEDLERSAKAGCPLCELFQHVLRESSAISHVVARSISDDLPLRLQAIVLEGISLLYDNHYGGKLCVLRRDCERGIFEVNYVHLYLDGGMTAESFDKITGRLVLPEADSDASFVLVREWIINCLYRHGQCEEYCQFPPSYTRAGIRQSHMGYTLFDGQRLVERTRDAFYRVGRTIRAVIYKNRQTIPQLPSRVIDVGHDDQDPFLYISPNNSKGHYIALSHSWGSVQPLTTTQQTLEERKRGIPIAQLPKTFRDAVWVTRKLGLQYLWIDSLCVIQDSKEDWDAESAVMGQLYSKSFVTIAAGGAANSTEGCFLPREASAIVVKLQLPDVDDSVYATTYIEETPFLRPTVLDTRAWCLQEAALSPRVLVYSKRMMGWLCNGCQESEQGINLEENRDAFADLAPRAPSRMYFHGVMEGQTWSFSERIKAVPIDMNDTRILWNNIVENYTQRSLTFGKDKLPALAGYARLFKGKTPWYSGIHSHGAGNSYCAGLWEGHFPDALLWKSNGGVCMSRPNNWRAPTWSWASLDGPVIYSKETFGFRKRLKGIYWVSKPSTIPASKDIYGAITGGSIYCRYPILEARCVEEAPPQGCPRYAKLIPIITDNPTGGKNVPAADFSKDAFAWFDTRMTNYNVLPQVWCAMLTKTAGLVLEPISLEKREFQRLAVFEMDQGWAKQCWVEPKFFVGSLAPSDLSKDIARRAKTLIANEDFFIL